jgi:NAD(P)-dependent dehydrogenase (short-subunit alcohol dehydrogenase family)
MSFGDRLSNKVAVITGAASGIGRAISLEFAKEGADVVLSDIDEKGLINVANQIREMGKKAVFVTADATRIHDVEKMLKIALEKFGRIDILVNSIGVLRGGKIEDLSEEDWDFVISVNLKGVFLCSQKIGKYFIENKVPGVIINIASISGILPQVYTGAYSPSKAGVILLSALMAMEWARYGIRVNCICPGPTRTPMTDRYYQGKLREARELAIPLGRFAEPEEIAKVAVFLASSDAKYITGTSLPVDGGSLQSMFFLVNYIRELISKEV